MGLSDELRRRNEAKQREIANAGNQLVAWTRAISDVCNRVKDLLDDSLKRGVIRLSRSTGLFRDKGTGSSYQADTLQLSDGEDVIVVAPASDHPAGAGRLDIANTANQSQPRYALTWHGGEEWVIAQVDRAGELVEPSLPLEKGSLEKALGALLGLADSRILDPNELRKG